MTYKSLTLFSLVAALLLSLVGAADVHADVAKINQLISSGRHSEAYYLTRQALKKDPKNPVLLDLAQQSYEAEQEAILKQIELAKSIMRTDANVAVEKAFIAPRYETTLLDESKKRTYLVEKEESDMLTERLSLNLTGADLTYVLGLLFRSTGINIIADEDLLAGKKMSIHVENLPVKDILQYMARTYGVGYTVTDNAVWITATDNPILEERVYSLKYGLTAIGQFPLATGGQAGQATSQQGKGIKEKESDSEKMMIWMETWPEWPAGSTYRLDQRTSKLYLLTTPEMHQRVAKMIATQDVEPTQVSITARFVSLSLDDMRELGVQWQSTSDAAIGKTHNGNEQDKYVIGQGTGFNPGIATGIGTNVILEGVLSSPQFEAIVHILDQNQDANVLSSPAVLALNNEPATIAITDEFVYATDYEAISSTTNSDGTATENVTGFVPTDFETIDDVGITLNVLASVGEDLNTILLTLNPKIKAFKENVNFQIVTTDGNGNTVTQPIQRPTFSNREVTSKAVVNSGDTVVLGGLMTKEETESINKVPFLGDIPFFGYLFRSQTKTDSKSNLMIFVTANIVEPSGDSKVSATAKEQSLLPPVNRPATQPEQPVDFLKGIPPQKPTAHRLPTRVAPVSKKPQAYNRGKVVPGSQPSNNVTNPDVNFNQESSSGSTDESQKRRRR